MTDRTAPMGYERQCGGGRRAGSARDFPNSIQAAARAQVVSGSIAACGALRSVLATREEATWSITPTSKPS
jgi:hypothetical protein